MNRIVYESLKVDLHIHSFYSKYKDELSIIENSSIENLNVLVQKLTENKVNIAAITDHDYFSYDMYNAFRSYEGTGTLKKVFPGVEFSVGFVGENGVTKCIHIVAIFDEKDDEKLKNIETILKTKDNKIDYGDNDVQFFTEEKFVNILNKIGLNVILIAHQKSSINSKNSYKNDLSSLGKDKFNEYLNSEVFDALEFKNMRNGMFNRLYALEKNENYDVVRFITGSDCHTWEAYPKHDFNSNDSDDFNFTYFKCLPTFKGLCMAFTDFSRISLSNSLFSLDDCKIDNLNISIGERQYDIPLSRGINVIIGDNSIGKSLLLHKINNYEYLKETKKKTGYEAYIKNNNIIISTQIDSNLLYHFDYQGNIRQRFESKNESLNQAFLQEKFPSNPDNNKYIEMINNQFGELYNQLELRFTYEDEIKKLKSLLMTDEEAVSKNIIVNKLNNNKTKAKDYNSVKKYISDILTKIGNPNEYKSKGLEEEDLNTIINVKKELKILEAKYESYYQKENRIYELKNAYNLGVDNLNSALKNYKSVLENKIENYSNDVTEVSNIIANLVKIKRKFKEFEFDINELDVKGTESPYGDYKFVRRFKRVSKIDNHYLQNTLNSVLKSGKVSFSLGIKEKELLDSIKTNGNESQTTALKLLKEKVDEKINEDFSIESVILKSEQNVYDDLSNGLNATMYFDIICNDTSKGIYFVDQPEDDVAQKAIKSNLIPDFKRMSSHRQIIMITHNPQFVVNLDVDNVICISKNASDEMTIEYGALEYEDEETNILKSVANNLDGGIDSIRKRWKRYGKENIIE